MISMNNKYFSINIIDVTISLKIILYKTVNLW